MLQNDIPLVLIEEHHEAFLACHHAMRAGVIPREGNILLHVDEHSDMSVPKLRTSPLHLQDIVAAKRFTYDELNIGTFICASIYANLFSEIYWMRRSHTFSKASRRVTVSNIAGNGISLSLKYCHPSEMTRSRCDSRSAHIHFIEPSDAFRCEGSVVLDIDLDYFLSNPHPQGPFEIEITASEYDHFTRNPYHCLRLLFSGTVTAHRSLERHFLRLCGSDAAAGDTFPPADLLESRVDALVQALKSNQVFPSLILLCRSVHSGYSPRSTEPHIRQVLIQRLGELFPIREHYITNLNAGDLRPDEHLERIGNSLLAPGN